MSLTISLGQSVSDHVLQCQAWIVEDGFAMRDEHDVDRPVEHPTKVVSDPCRSLLVRRPPFRWHPQAPLVVAFDDITEDDDALGRESEYGFAPPSPEALIFVSVASPRGMFRFGTHA